MSLMPDRIPAVAAGAKVTHGASRYGHIGLLAMTAQREIVGLTVRTVVADGAMATISLGNSRANAGPARQMAADRDEDSPIAALICAVPLNASIRARSEFAGLEEARFPIEPPTGRQALYLERADERVPLKTVTATGATVYRREDGKRLVYHGAMEIGVEPGTLRAGDAGAAIATGNGTPVGLLVGTRGDVAIAAPLEPIFRVARLRPLTALEASRHFGSALLQRQGDWLAFFIAQELKPRNPDLLLIEIGPVFSSDELLATIDIPSIAR